MRVIFFIICCIVAVFNWRIGAFLFFVYSWILEIYDSLAFNPATNPNYTDPRAEREKAEWQRYQEQQRNESQKATVNAYGTLGVSTMATNEEVRKAYRNLAMKYHPDHNNSPNASQRFREVHEAYETIKKIRGM